MEIVNDVVWKEWQDNNKDEYGKKVINYTEYWANLMEEEISKGKSFSDFVKNCSDRADIDNISRAMFEATLLTLATCWKYGKQLLEWYINDEG